MATLVSTIKRFVGLSSETKPLSEVQAGSTFLETDTGDLYGFSGVTWSLKTESSVTLRINLEDLLSQVLDEAKKTNDYLEIIAGSVSG